MSPPGSDGKVGKVSMTEQELEQWFAGRLAEKQRLQNSAVMAGVGKIDPQSCCLFCGGELPVPAPPPGIASTSWGVCESCQQGVDPAVLDWMRPAFQRLAKLLHRHFGQVLSQVSECQHRAIHAAIDVREAALAAAARERERLTAAVANRDMMIADQQAVILSLTTEKLQLADALGGQRELTAKQERWITRLYWACGLLAAAAVAGWILAVGR